jgi:hypothetical protein
MKKTNRSKLRGIRIKISLTDSPSVIFSIAFLPSLNISLLFFHLHAYLLYWQNSHHFKILLPIVV